MSGEEMSGMQIGKGFSLLGKMLPGASGSQGGMLKCWSAFPPLEVKSLKPTGREGKRALEKRDAFSKKANIPPMDSFTIIMDFPIVVMFIAFPPFLGSLNVPYWKDRTSHSEFWLETHIIVLLIPSWCSKDTVPEALNSKLEPVLFQTKDTVSDKTGKKLFD